MNINGYETFTTFWDDFSIADRFGVHAIKDTFTRAFNEWKHDYRYLTELVLVLNWKCWYYHDKRNHEYRRLYSDLYYEASEYAGENLSGEAARYYFGITD